MIMEDVAQENEPNVHATDQPPGTPVSLSLSEIEALKDRIEQQKANKLKAEQLVSTLSRIKAREKASRRSSKPGEKKADDGVSNQPAKRSGTNSSSALKEKSNLLRKKLEEDRARFESKKGQEDLGRVSEIVEHIRVQLEDQDKTIQQIHSNFASPKAQQPVEEVVPPEPDIPPEVKQRIADLEMKILDLQENLREKDSVISARTQAITLLSEDMARKAKATLDTLEETRGQMKTMQANFIALEDRMSEERSRLKDEVEAKKLRLQQLEKNYRAAESARFDLSTRVAELQEKVVALQTKNLALEEEVAESNNKTKELTEALENNNKQTIKMKAQFKAKFKALEEERDVLKKESNTNEELNRLRERIAELEDEKEAGNLLKERIAEMEEKLHRQECDLDSHIKAMSRLEAEKLDLIEDSRMKDNILKEKEDLVVTFKAQISQLEETKISAEMKCLELEEKLDNFMKMENDTGLVNSELEKANQKLLEYRNTIEDLSSKLQNKEGILRSDRVCEMESSNEVKSLQDMSSSLTEWQKQYSLLEERLNITLAHCNELEHIKLSLETENEKLMKDCDTFKETVEKLNQMLQTKTESPGEEVILLRQSLTQKDNELCTLDRQSKTLQSEVDNLRVALQSTTAEVHRLYQQVEQLSSTQQKVEELNENLHNKDKQLEERTRKLSEYKKFHKLKSEDVLRISHELETVTTSLQQRIGELQDELNNARKVEEELRKEINSLKENKSSEPESLDKKLEEQSLKMKKLAANVKLKTKLVKDLEIKVEERENALQQKDILISSLEGEKAQLQQQLVELSICGNDYPPNINELLERCKRFEVETNSLKEELTLKSVELEALKSTSGDTYDTLVQIKELENQNQKLTDISETKSDQLRKMESEISDLSGFNKSLLSELEQMQDNYRQDSLKNESVLESFESEMLGNKKEILELSNQLKDVTSKYEQAWAKLQEKEGYIEELESQLEKVKLRLLKIESTVEERRQSLEERAEMLGARLCLAEKNNEELEKHKGELEHKIAHLFGTEEMLGNALEKLQLENQELSKSLNESVSSNTHLSQELVSEHNKVLALAKEVNDLQTSLTNYEKIVEDYEVMKTQLKELQEARDHEVKYLESRLTETEQFMEAEIQRFSDRIAAVESERQDVVEKYESLCTEKQLLEEEFSNVQQTIVDITKEELEDLKSNHVVLEEQLKRELDKRESYIKRIKDLETQLLSQNTTSANPSTHLSQEIVELREQLNEEINNKERLNYELLKEKAKQQIDDVVARAEETYFTMTETPEQSVESTASVGQKPATVETYFQFPSSGDPENKLLRDQICELENKLSLVNSENANLKSRLLELESHGKNLSESSGALMESDDWASANKDEDDGWGWGSKDAILEHEYSQKQKVNSELESKVTDLENRLRHYEEENSRLSEDLKTAQTKCSKLFKKVKEFKNKSDSLERNSRERSVGFDDLDIAMHEELKSQVEKLEKSLKECSTNLNSLQIEKEGLLKRIDTLTSGNERLIEMKERQDIEVEMWQRRSNELQHKVQGLEWTIAELQEQTDTNIEKYEKCTEVETQHFLSNASEMEEKINVLAAENDYLQSLIVEMKEKEKTSQIVGPKLCESNQITVQLQSNETPRLSIESEKTESKGTNDDVTEYLERIEKLSKENERLSSELEIIKITGDSKYSNENIQYLKETCNALKLENERLNSVVSILKEKFSELWRKYEVVKTEIKNDSRIAKCLGNINIDENILATDMSVNIQTTIEPLSASDESPVLFRGFTSLGDDLFVVSSESNPFFDSRTSQSTNDLCASTSHQVDFFDKVAVGVLESGASGDKSQVEQQQSSPPLLPEIDKINTKKETGDYVQEISSLKKLLIEKDTELSSLRKNVAEYEIENANLKRKIEECADNSPWAAGPATYAKEFDRKIGENWGNDVRSLSKTLDEKELTINNLRAQLNYESSHLFESKDQYDLNNARNESFSNLFSQAEESQEGNIEQFVEQITQLTKTLQNRENEIETLTDKKNKYKDMYYNLAKEYDDQSRDQSNCDKDQLTDQNMMLNQLLDDKESELEIINQQIDQTIVAKDNLQDELCFKLCEMEAASESYTIQNFPDETLLHSAQPENIEDVRTLCAEVAELNKLLQEKESEVEILKQRLDESNLEKENLIDEWKKEIEKYKEKSNMDYSKEEEMRKELESFKNGTIADIEKQYKDELSLKDQQLMNAINDLRNTHSYCQDIQDKLNELENNLKACNQQNGFLVNELNEYKKMENSLIQETSDGTQMNLIDRVQRLKENLLQIEAKWEQAKKEIEVKDKIIIALKDKTLETTAGFEERTVTEQPSISSNVKQFATEPFRISTEQSSSDEDSSYRNMENIQNQMFIKEIESLKQVLSMKDTEITKMSIALNEAQENLIRGEMRFINSEEESLRQRLDEALYTLHLRDVRCDELALELMQLLEERDSLQLRLSTAIRFNEELRAKSKQLDEAYVRTEGEASASPPLRPDDSTDHQLKQKLDQLHNVGYRRDPEMQQDQQRRYQEQMHLYTPHSSQDDYNQSSGGFFNWIFGSSPSGSQDV